ncbi:MAG: universal stress protein [Phycisphaeraceae bacterium]|nr:universal stress protein [Phycisphaeraceae bacterium]
MLLTEDRPRSLRWFHAGPLLYGDWGTSRLYVLGLAFFFTAHASVVFLAAIAVLMVAVAWAYTLICRCFPDGGGVYTAARQLNHTWAVVGATLLIGGYIMTVAISVVEAYHYFGIGSEWIFPLSVATIALIGVLNWLGARSAGRFALVIAFVALAVSLLIALLAIPFFFKGVRSIEFVGLGTPQEAWVHFTRVCLALAGIEAVANMTGLMRKPVARTARRTIWPVLLEVVALNLFFGIAITGLPTMIDIHQAPVVTYADSPLPPEVLAVRDTAMNVLAQESAVNALGHRYGGIFAASAAIIFGLLLLSAANTAVMATVSVLYSMAQDREMPRPLTRLNYSGVPWVGLITACVAPLAVLAITRDVAVLAELYVIGVFGAVTTSVMALAMNRALEIARRERIGLWILGVILTLISLTIVFTAPNATLFGGVLVCSTLAVRQSVRWFRRGAPPPLDQPQAGWLSEIQSRPAVINPDQPRIMLASRGRYQSEFAVDLARRRKAALFAIYVRTLRLIDFAPGTAPRLEADPDAQQALGTTALLARQAGVPFVPIYVVSTEIADEILDYTVTYGCDTLIVGKSRRSLFARRVEGDVVTRVAAGLPDDVALITRAADTPHVPRPIPQSSPSETRPQAPADDDHLGHA